LGKLKNLFGGDSTVAKGKNKKAHQLGWRSKKANHKSRPCKGK